MMIVIVDIVFVNACIFSFGIYCAIITTTTSCNCIDCRFVGGQQRMLFGGLFTGVK
jgi:hypothetical protein